MQDTCGTARCRLRDSSWVVGTAVSAVTMQSLVMEWVLAGSYYAGLTDRSRSSAPKKGQFQGAWVGSEVSVEHIEALRHRRVLPLADLVAARVRGAEAVLTPEKGEVVVFEEHFYHGFGLPASDFFSRFLTFFGPQPYHVAPNASLQLAAFVVLCEGFIGIEPRLDLWCKLFFFKQQSMTTNKSVAAEQSGPKTMTPAAPRWCTTG
ncbi:hypothetical protein D1007_43497 [Hordeum vulgare]|nr:hypothetical protein D1007_43497 [Hordeum vulgare]